MVDSPPTVTSEQEICDLLHDAAMVCNVDPIMADLSIPELLCQVIHQVVGTVQVQDRLRLIGGRGNQDFVTHWVLLTVPISYSAHPPILGVWWTVPQLVGQPP